jgi:hypothetical protein
MNMAHVSKANVSVKTVSLEIVVNLKLVQIPVQIKVNALKANADVRLDSKESTVQFQNALMNVQTEEHVQMLLSINVHVIPLITAMTVRSSNAQKTVQEEEYATVCPDNANAKQDSPALIVLKNPALMIVIIMASV